MVVCTWLLPWTLTCITAAALGDVKFWDGVLGTSQCAEFPSPNQQRLGDALLALEERPWNAALKLRVQQQLEDNNSCGVNSFLCDLLILIKDAYDNETHLKVTGNNESQVLRQWMQQHLHAPLPSFFRVAASVLPEVMQATGAAIEHWVRERNMQLERYDSCQELRDTGDDLMAVNADETKSGITYWSKAMTLAEKIQKDGGFEWTNSARVAFSSSLIGPKARRQCPSGVMAMKFVRCIGHDNEQKQEEVFTLDKDAEELLQWNDADLPLLLYNAWPLWGLTALLAKQRHHSFVLSAPEIDMQEAPVLQVLQSGYQPHGTGTIIVSSLKDMTSEEMAVWLSRLRRSLLTPRIDHHVVLVLSKSIKTCRPFLWFGASGPLLHCVWSVDDASLELDAQSIALFTLSHAMPTALLSTATIPFPGLGDQLFDLLMRTDGSFAMFATDMQVAVGAGERNQRLAIHPPFMDVGFRLFRPVSATVVLLRMATLVAYSNPFLLAEDVLNRFNATMETDFLLNASHGFVSSEGWFAEDLQQRLYGPGGSNSTDPHLSGGIVLFSMRPFSMMPKWFRGTACQHVCKSNLHCAEEALGSACALLGDDEALLKTLRNTFMLQHPAARSARPRLLQAGPSSCGTTAIAHYFSDGHNLRVAKNYVEGREIRDHVRKDLQLRLAPYRSLDRFDVVADAFDIVRVGVHFCSDHLGHGGQNCEQVHGDFLDMNLREYRYILESLRDAYPNLRFIHNSCNLQSWLSKRVHNCWPHLVSVGPSADWEAPEMGQSLWSQWKQLLLHQS
eukprot:symbB.v1.2.008435.t1/scaffold530.1/size191304/3